MDRLQEGACHAQLLLLTVLVALCCALYCRLSQQWLTSDHGCVCVIHIRRLDSQVFFSPLTPIHCTFGQDSVRRVNHLSLAWSLPVIYNGSHSNFGGQSDSI